VTPKALLAALLLVVLTAAVTYAVVSEPEVSERTREAMARADSLEGVVGRLAEAKHYTDSLARARIDEAEQTRIEMDTVWRTALDTVRAAVPEPAQPALERMVRADSVEDVAYEAEIAALEAQVHTRDSLIAGLRAKMRAKEAVVAGLKDDLTASLGERIFGSVGQGTVKVAIIGAALWADRPEAAAGAGAMWAVDVVIGTR